MLTQGKLHSLLSYDPDTGVFKWNVGFSNRVKVGCIAGYINGDGYREIMIDGTSYKAHRLAWMYIHGAMPPMIDHINRNRSDNRLKNLRICNASQNSMNRKVQKNNKSGVPGVLWNKLEKKWKASAKIKGKSIHLGTYLDKDEAINVREAFCKQAYAEFYVQA